MFMNKKIQGGRFQFVNEKATLTQEAQDSPTDFKLTTTGEQKHK